MSYLGLYLFFGLPISLGIAICTNKTPVIRRVLFALVYLPVWPIYLAVIIHEGWTVKRLNEVCAWCGAEIVEHTNAARLERWREHHKTCPNHPLRPEIDRLTAELATAQKQAQLDDLEICSLEGRLEDAEIDNRRLTAELAAARGRERWIPCAERMPAPGSVVLMWIQPHTYIPGNPKEGAYMPMVSPHAPWRSTWDAAYYAPDEITHWRELPAAPAQEEA